MTSLQPFVDAWSTSCRAVLEVGASLAADDWEAATGCPAWSVRDVVAHLAAIEHELADGRPEPVRDASPGPVVSAEYTARGVDARRDRAPEDLLAELETAVTVRSERLRVLPEDPAAAPPHTPGGVGWDWQTLLRNRAVDAWVHEQDIRRATGRTGGFVGPGVRVVADTFAGAMGYVLGKRVGAAAGTTVVWDVYGAVPFEVAFRVDDDGRARAVDPVAAAANAVLRMDTETFTLLAAGRHPRYGVDVALAGDPRLCGTVLAHMPVTP